MIEASSGKHCGMYDLIAPDCGELAMNEIKKGHQADLLNVALGKSSGEWYHPVAPLDIIVLSSSAWGLLRSTCPNRWDKRHGKGFAFTIPVSRTLP